MPSEVFIPTFLYIKQHSITGKLYFGKTTQNPETYLDSGVYWTKHIKKHGKHYVINLWYCLFYDRRQCEDFALSFSKTQNIVESTSWANYTFENGTDGFASGEDHPMRNPLVRQKLSSSTKGVPKAPKTEDHKRKISQALSQIPRTSESNVKRSRTMKGNTNSTGPHTLVDDYHTARPKLTCPHCGKETAINIAKSKHFDKCKFYATN